MLAAPIIKEALKNLSCNEKEKVVILSPDHFKQLDKNQLLLTNEAGEKFLQTKGLVEKSKTNYLINNRGVTAEHGFQGLVSFVADRCPQTEIIPLILNLDDRQQQNIFVLGKRAQTWQDTTFIISSDFSHAGDLETTMVNDQQSLQGLLQAEFGKIKNDCQNCWQFLQGYYSPHKINFVLQTNKNSTDFGGNQQNITSYFTGYFK